MKKNPLDNQNPRIGVLLRLYGASMPLQIIMQPYLRWGLNRFQNTFPEHDDGVWPEWRALLARRERKLKKLLAARRRDAR